MTRRIEQIRWGSGCQSQYDQVSLFRTGLVRAGSALSNVDWLFVRPACSIDARNEAKRLLADDAVWEKNGAWKSFLGKRSEVDICPECIYGADFPVVGENVNRKRFSVRRLARSQPA